MSSERDQTSPIMGLVTGGNKVSVCTIHLLLKIPSLLSLVTLFRNDSRKVGRIINPLIWNQFKVHLLNGMSLVIYLEIVNLRQTPCKREWGFFLFVLLCYCFFSRCVLLLEKFISTLLLSPFTSSLSRSLMRCFFSQEQNVKQNRNWVIHSEKEIKCWKSKVRDDFVFGGMTASPREGSGGTLAEHVLGMRKVPGSISSMSR